MNMCTNHIPSALTSVKHYLPHYVRTKHLYTCANPQSLPAVCYSKAEARECEDEFAGVWFNQTCFNGTYLDQFNETIPGCTGDFDNCTSNVMREELANLSKRVVSASEEYMV